MKSLFQPNTFFLAVLLLSTVIMQAQLPRNCKDILDSNASASSGVYTIDPDGAGPLPAMQCNCDMTTDGGGWTLVLNYNHKSGTNPALKVDTNKLPLIGSILLGNDESTTASWGHADTAIMCALQFNEVRFYGITSNHSRVIHFKTKHTGTINYFTTGIGTTAGIKNDFTPLTGHTAYLPAAIDMDNYDQGNFAMTEYPLWTGSTYHWFLSPLFNRWEVDDYTFSLPDTYHQIWVRECASHRTINITVCDSIILNGQVRKNSGIVQFTLKNRAGCDSFVNVNLTVNTSPIATLTKNGSTLTALPVGAAYKWIDCANGNTAVTGATAQSFTPVKSSSYAVVVSKNGCADTSDCMFVVASGIRQNENQLLFSVAPNPGKGNFNLQLKNALTGQVSFTVTDMQGRVVYTETTVSDSDNLKINLNLTGLTPGFYLLHIENSGFMASQKLIIN